jgi:hypothetical protein
MSVRLVDRVSGLLAARTDRRGFLVRSAITGTALVAAPGAFVLRPTTAYAAVCSCSGSSCACGSLCCDGYTEMCCTVTGANRCPPGTFAGGWWKADGSGFCGDAPRYYIDCNVVPGQSPCGCGCANGDCGNRKSCCTVFRYGQCHQDIPNVTAIMCRVITCTPPWVFDPKCSTSPATDNGTRGHDRPCLHNPIGNIDGVAATGLGKVRVVGWAADPDLGTAPIDVDIYVDGGFRARTRADRPRGDIEAAVPGAGVNHGFDVTIAVEPNALGVCAYAINQGPGAQNPLLACWPVPHNPFGSVDDVAVVPGLGYRVRGWAIDPDGAGPTDVHVYGDGALVAVVRADQPRTDVAALYPDYGANHGYEAVIANGASNVCVYVINNTGAGSNQLLGCRTLPHSPFGNVEQVSIVPDGGIRVKGWVIDPDSASSIAVDVYVDGGFAQRIVADADRPDVQAIYPGHGRALGYDVVLPFPDARTVCVYGINAGPGDNATLGCRPHVHEPFGSLDRLDVAAGGLRLQGWAIDPDRAGPIEVHVYVDGHIAAITRADRDRPDIAAAFPSYGGPHGYDVTVPVPRGAHQVCAYGINQPAGSSNPTLGCRTATF